MAWIKFIHVILGVTFFGGVIGSYFYTSSQSSRVSREFICQNAAKLDLFVFIPMIVIAAITGTLLVIEGIFTFSTPWIIAAYTFLSLILFMLMLSAQLKKNKKTNRMYHLVNILMILFLAAIVHDAVMKHTLFGYFIL